jgi:CRISPR/Cas system Type II protein with McrA/HNH and RuvC-like nuclease domain
MNVEQLFDRVIVYNQTIGYDEREDIVDNILETTKNLPLKKPFTKEQLLSFADKDLILYLTDVYELFGIKYFTDLSKQL